MARKEELVIEPPDRIVGMVIYKDRLVVATERHIYEKADGVFRPLLFVKAIEED